MQQSASVSFNDLTLKKGLETFGDYLAVQIHKK